MKGEGEVFTFADMKKLLIIAIMSAAAALCVSCGEAGSNQDNSEITPAQQSVTSETSSQAQPDSSMFSVLPEGADKVLDTAAKSADNAYPVKKEYKRSFGYMGKDKVNGADCYCFKVYDCKDDEFDYVADVAVSVSDSKVFTRQVGKTYVPAA